jgi:hypothetical protein
MLRFYTSLTVSRRVPGIVFDQRTYQISKAADYVQQRNVNLVKRGCIVLIYDYFMYGDRKTGTILNSPEGPNSHGITQLFVLSAVPRPRLKSWTHFGRWTC